MNAQVEAAWIAGASGLLGVLVGVTGTVIVGVVGFRSTRNATAATNTTTKDVLQAQIQAAHDDRLYDKRAEVYVDLLRALGWNMHRREIMTQRLDSRVPADELPAQPEGIDWEMIDARMQVFGTAATFTAVQDFSTANYHAERAWAAWAASRQDAYRTLAVEAVSAADDAASALVALVRGELNPDTTPLRRWQPPGVSGSDEA